LIGSTFLGENSAEASERLNRFLEREKERVGVLIGGN